LIRKRFRDSCLNRDNYRCVICKVSFKYLDVHHIKNRNLIINGGYVPENGITLCSECHLKAEEFRNIGTPHKGFAPEELYKLIDSSYEKAVKASEKLKEYLMEG